MPKTETTVGLTKQAAEELRQAKRELAAQQQQTLTMSDVVRYLVQSWRQDSGAPAGMP